MVNQTIPIPYEYVRLSLPSPTLYSQLGFGPLFLLYLLLIIYGFLAIIIILYKIFSHCKNAEDKEEKDNPRSKVKLSLFVLNVMSYHISTALLLSLVIPYALGGSVSDLGPSPSISSSYYCASFFGYTSLVGQFTSSVDTSSTTSTYHTYSSILPPLIASGDLTQLASVNPVSMYTISSLHSYLYSCSADGYVDFGVGLVANLSSVYEIPNNPCQSTTPIIWNGVSVQNPTPNPQLPFDVVATCKLRNRQVSSALYYLSIILSIGTVVKDVVKIIMWAVRYRRVDEESRSNPSKMPSRQSMWLSRVARNLSFLFYYMISKNKFILFVFDLIHSEKNQNDWNSLHMTLIDLWLTDIPHIVFISLLLIFNADSPLAYASLAFSGFMIEYTAASGTVMRLEQFIGFITCGKCQVKRNTRVRDFETEGLSME